MSKNCHRTHMTSQKKKILKTMTTYITGQETKAP